MNYNNAFCNLVSDNSLGLRSKLLRICRQSWCSAAGAFVVITMHSRSYSLFRGSHVLRVTGDINPISGDKYVLDALLA